MLVMLVILVMGGQLGIAISCRYVGLRKYKCSIKSRGYEVDK